MSNADGGRRILSPCCVFNIKKERRGIHKISTVLDLSIDLSIDLSMVSNIDSTVIQP